MLRFLDRWPATAHLKSEISNLIPLAESCSRQLRAWADSLQNSDIKGPRHLSAATRADYQGRKRAQDFLATLDMARSRPAEPTNQPHPSHQEPPAP